MISEPERWASIAGYEGLYSVSDHGRVRNDRSNRVMKAVGARLRYPRVNLYRDGIPYCACVHALVAAAFLGPRPAGKEVNHKDGDRSHNHYSNLEYITHAENLQHAHDHGLVCSAKASGNARTRISEADVRRLRRSALVPRSQLLVLASEIGITERHALHIMHGERWLHLKYLSGEHIRPKA